MIANDDRSFHSEGRIVTTLFGLLFWDILFASVDGAFETKFQNAPLDLLQDTFYLARESMIEDRLSEIEAGKAAEIIGVVDKRERERKSVCIGVHWDKFTEQDLREVAEVCVRAKDNEPV